MPAVRASSDGVPVASTASRQRHLAAAVGAAQRQHPGARHPRQRARLDRGAGRARPVGQVAPGAGDVQRAAHRAAPLDHRARAPRPEGEGGDRVPQPVGQAQPPEVVRPRSARRAHRLADPGVALADEHVVAPPRERLRQRQAGGTGSGDHDVSPFHRPRLPACPIPPGRSAACAWRWSACRCCAPCWCW